MQEHNSPTVVADIMRRLGDNGANCALFGGWAEEARGLSPPRTHADIDLLLPAPSFHILDNLLRSSLGDLKEIALKRFAHKRAFLVNGLMVEVVLVQLENGTAFTWFWGDVRFEWILPLANYCLLGSRRLSVVSRHNLQRYRTLYRSTEPWRWQDQTMLVPRPA